MGTIYEQVKERMIRYAKIDTQSLPFSGTWPTTPGQRDLGEELYRELSAFGAKDVYFDVEHCVVYAKIPGNADAEPVGFVAHLDTAPDAPGRGVKPWVLENYDGGDILLNKERGIVMRAKEYPNLAQYRGQDLILTDGTTLLGGDDKAAIAAVMTFAQHLLENPDIPRPEICLAFTPDEEVGGLAQDMDLARFGAKRAYTLDGDHLGWYMDETFNASQAHVVIRGLSVHTGTAKGLMKNAVDIAAQFMAMLPQEEKPQYTEGREGFYHMIDCHASCEEAVMDLIIRDHDRERFEDRERYVLSRAEALNRQYGEDTVSVSIEEQYRNMKEVIDTVPELVRNLKRAIESSGITPVCEPFRGGTDGAELSFRGLPCPNLSAGYENAHGRFEYVPVQSMEKNVEILTALCRIFAGDL